MLLSWISKLKITSRNVSNPTIRETRASASLACVFNRLCRPYCVTRSALKVYTNVQCRFGGGPGELVWLLLGRELFRVLPGGVAAGL